MFLGDMKVNKALIIRLFLGMLAEGGRRNAIMQFLSGTTNGFACALGASMKENSTEEDVGELTGIFHKVCRHLSEEELNKGLKAVVSAPENQAVFKGFDANILLDDSPEKKPVASEPIEVMAEAGANKDLEIDGADDSSESSEPEQPVVAEKSSQESESAESGESEAEEGSSEESGSDGEEDGSEDDEATSGADSDAGQKRVREQSETHAASPKRVRKPTVPKQIAPLQAVSGSVAARCKECLVNAVCVFGLCKQCIAYVATTFRSRRTTSPIFCQKHDLCLGMTVQQVDRMRVALRRVQKFKRNFPNMLNKNEKQCSACDEGKFVYQCVCKHWVCDICQTRLTGDFVEGVEELCLFCWQDISNCMKQIQG